MTAANAVEATPVLLPPGAGEHVWGTRACITVKVATGAVSALEFLAPPDFGPPLHVHHLEDELVQVLEGTLRIVCGDRDELVGAGGFAFLPRGVPHAFWVVAGPARLLAVMTPGGVEGLFVDSGRPADSARLPAPGAVPPGSTDPHEERYGVETVGPPIGPPAG
jgi:mannose-6-phosphate isomerase-like protein (cupin superfamily)